MPATVPPKNPPGPLRIRPSPHHGQNPGHPRRHPIHHIIKLRSRPPEPLIARTPIPHHRVQRVDRPISQQSGHAPDKPPHQRRHHGIRSILRDRLNGRPSQFLLPQPNRIPSTQMRQQLPGFPNVPTLKSPGHPQPFPPKRGTPQHSPGGHRSDTRPPTRPPPSEQFRRYPNPNRTPDQHPHINQPAPLRIHIEPPLQPLGHPSKKGHRMPAPRIPKEDVQRHPQQQPFTRAVHRVPPSGTPASPAPA
jgi:hypothetical protein